MSYNSNKVNLFVISFLMVLIALVIGYFMDLGRFFNINNAENNLTQINQSIIDYYKKNNLYPKHTSGISIYSSGVLIGYQGIIDENLKQLLGLKGNYSDNYIYNVNVTLDRYQLSYIEGKSLLAQGDNMGVVFENDYPMIAPGKDIELSDGKKYNVVVSNDWRISGDKEQLVSIKGTYLYEQSCYDYLQKNPDLKGKSGPQTIHPLKYMGESFDVYCDMSTDNGGWTITTMIADNKTNNIFNTENELKITDLNNNIASKGRIDNIWTDSQDKDIMIKCFMNNVLFQGYNKPLIIYGFKKNDINNLVKDTIAGSQFSSKKLNAFYDGGRYLLKDIYGGSSVAHTMRIQSINNEDIYYHNKGEFLKCQTILGKKTVCKDSDSLRFSPNNYCITAIR